MKLTKNINLLSKKEFLSIFRNVFEKSDWIADKAFDLKPFENSKVFVIKMMNLPITWNTYYKILIQNLKTHAIGKLFFSFSKAKLSQKIYILLAAGMYVWNIYQNIISCYRFYKNSYYITNNFETINSYLDYTIEKIKLFNSLTKNYKSYNKFNDKLLLYKEKLQKFHNLIRDLPKNSQKIGKVRYIGKLMKYFYTLYADDEIENIVLFSFGFHGYIDSILGIYKNIEANNINSCKFSKKLTFKSTEMYHPSIKTPIKNNVDDIKIKPLAPSFSFL